MKAASRSGMIPWADVFELRHRQDSSKPLHVQVVEAGPAVPHVRPGDELFLHEIITDEISLKRRSSSLSAPDPRGKDYMLTVSEFKDEQSDEVEILLSRHYSAGFILSPRYPMSHCFKSVREIIHALPAVSRIIYPCDGFDIGNEAVKAMERLEILEQIRDPLTGMNMLSVVSMKTDVHLLLPADMRASFVQLSSECFKCGPAGITASECTARWRPGQLPFHVKLCPPRTEETQQSLLKVPKQTKQKREKKDKKKKHSSWCDFENVKISELQSEADDRWLIPEGWRDKPLYLKPFQKIRVQNIMFAAKDFTLPESAILTVKVLSAELSDTTGITIGYQQQRNRVPSSPDRFAGHLSQLPIDLVTMTRDPLLVMVTGGETTTSLRQQARISQGCRLAIHGIQQSEKIVMVCERDHKLLVSLSYAGTFRRIPPTSKSPDFRAEKFQNMLLPCKVHVTQGDRGLGYDQLSRRAALIATELITETTLLVEMVGADGAVISEHPFEIPLCRTNLCVKVLDGKPLTVVGSVSMDRLRRLPTVEFITEAQLEYLKRSPRRDSLGPETSFESTSPVFPLSQQNPTANINRTSRPREDVYTRPVKPGRNGSTGGDGDLVCHLPPRPPKSPNLMQQDSAQLRFNLTPPESHSAPPALPPKPNRYRNLAVTYSDDNSNSNNSKDDITSPHLKQTSRISPSSTTAQRPHPITSFPMPITRQPNAIRTSFQEMHDIFEPSRYNVDGQLITIEEESVIPQKQKFDVGLYGEQNHVKPGGSFQNILKRTRRGKHSGTSIVNPNYAERLGDGMYDPVLQGTAFHGNLKDDGTSIYSFANDVEPVCSFSDDSDDYETPLSPTKERRAVDTEEDRYLHNAQGALSTRRGIPPRIISQRSEEEYETPIYDDVCFES